MPTSLLTRVDWSKIYPPLVEQMFNLAGACRARGSDYYAIAGYRSFADQAKLYFQGRTTPGKKVTWAKPGESLHNYGLAVDWCWDKDVVREGLQPDWAVEEYEILGAEAAKLGLESGLFWRKVDAPHVQLKISDKGIRLADLKAKHDEGGLEAVWKFLDLRGPWF